MTVTYLEMRTKSLVFVARIVDIVAAPFVIISSVILKTVRRAGLQRMPVSRHIFNAVGVLPIMRHYYEPVFHPDDIKVDYSKSRVLPALNLNMENQLALVLALQEVWVEEPEEWKEEPFKKYIKASKAFDQLDALFYFNIIRYFKPNKIIEIGGGTTTFIALSAMKSYKEVGEFEDSSITSIEPFESVWIEKAKINWRQDLVENIDLSEFKALESGDILFIDSSHVIRPGGDVLYEIFEILPSLKPGVIIHFHDIFTPRHYQKSWQVEQVKFFNEQFLIEAFLSYNDSFEIIFGVNSLSIDASDLLCEFIAQDTVNGSGGSFYIKKVK